MKRTRKIISQKQKKATSTDGTCVTLEPIPDDILEFIEKFRTIKGKPFTLKGREYQIGIYRDPVRQINVLKARQMGMTEFAMNWLLYHLLRYDYTVGLYVIDRQEHVDAFAKRMHDAIMESEKLKPWVIKMTNSHIEFANHSILYMTTGWNKFESVRSYSVDFAVVDEAQTQDLEALPVLKETMSSSIYKRLLVIGTGSDEGDEWFKEWSRGTIMEWHPPKAKEVEKSSQLSPGIG